MLESQQPTGAEAVLHGLEHTLPHGELSLRLTSGEHVISGRSHATAVRAALGI
jgi:hypothetical protein